MIVLSNIRFVHAGMHYVYFYNIKFELRLCYFNLISARDLYAYQYYKKAWQFDGWSKDYCDYNK